MAQAKMKVNQRPDPGRDLDLDPYRDCVRSYSYLFQPADYLGAQTAKAAFRGQRQCCRVQALPFKSRFNM